MLQSDDLHASIYSSHTSHELVNSRKLETELKESVLTHDVGLQELHEESSSNYTDQEADMVPFERVEANRIRKQ